MLVLAFDTSISGFTIALLSDSKTIAKTTITEAGKQSELLVLEIEKILKSQNIWYQDLDLIAASKGPGSFTGTRIGITCAKTIKLACKLPLILVSSLEVAAFAYKSHEGKIFVTLDAGLGELFTAEFLSEKGSLSQISKASTIKAEELTKYLPQDQFLLCKASEKDITAEAVGLIALDKRNSGKIEENEDAVYLRQPQISQRKK